MQIDESNYLEAISASRDILFMFADMAECYRGFGSDIDTGSFDPFAYVRSFIAERPGYSLGVNQTLLTTGAAVAILCGMVDRWDQGDPQYVSELSWFKKAQAVVEDEVLSDYPDLSAAIRVGLADEEAMRSLLPSLYQKYVAGYFARLAHGGG